MKYVKLLSKKHNDIVLRIDGRKIYQYDPFEKKWIETTLFLNYLYEHSPYYDLYEFIDEKTAMDLVIHQKERID